MNQYTESNKTAQSKPSERFKIKSKYFGEYEPQLFIASRSKSKSRSTSKDDQNKFALKGVMLKTQTKATLQSKSNNNKQANSINPQISKSSTRSYNSSNLSEYLLNRAASPGRKKEGSAIQKIIHWVERKYNQKILNEKLEKGTSLSMIQSRRVQNKNEEERFQEDLKKIVYDLYIIKRLKRKKSYTPTSIQYDKSRLRTKNNLQETIIHESKTKTSYLKNLSSQYGVSKDIKTQHLKNEDKEALNNSKQHDIDNITSNQTNHSEKVQDFGIYRFKNAEMYSNGTNQLFPISELSIEDWNRSAFKNSVQENNTQNKPQKNVEIPTMNSLQNLNAQSRTYRAQSQNFLGTQLNKNFFTQTARSTSTNEILEISKNSIDENSFQDKQKNFANDFLLKSSPFSEKQLKKSFTMESGHEASDKIHNSAESKQESEASLTFQLNQTNNGSKTLNSMGPELKSCSQLSLMQMKKKLKNETGLCDSDYWPFALFHPQKTILALSSIEINPLNKQTGQNDEILNQIFQMNDNQHRILKALNNKNSLNSQISKLQSSKIFNQNKQENNVENKTPQAFKLQQFNNQPSSKNIGVKSPRGENPNAKIETKASNIIINGQKVQINSKIKQHKKFAAQNYFSQHLQVKQSPIHKIQMIQTFEMPLNRKNDQKVAADQNHPSPVRQSNVFTFNSLTQNSQKKPEIIRKKPQYKIPQQQQKNAFVKNCNIFGLCDMVSPKNDRNGQKEMGRSNHFTDNSTSGRDERSKSNQSKKSSKPKISFNYVSPNAKQPQIQNKQKKDEQNQSILLKSQSSHLRNSGQAPVKIQIKTSRQNKNTTVENKILPVQKIPELPVLSRQYNQIKEKAIKSQTLIGDQKLRSYSVPHFAVQKTQDQINLKQQDDVIRRKFETKNAFFNRGYETVQNYNSQRLLPVNGQNGFVQQKYQPIQSYYFPNPQNQNVKIQPIPLPFDGGRILKGKQSQFSPQKDHVYLFPISNSLQKEKRQRVQSLSNKHLITVKKNIPQETTPFQ